MPCHPEPESICNFSANDTSYIKAYNTSTKTFKWERLARDNTMETFIDYYAVLGVDVHASNDTIKAAFKKLALKYHPDVYKGEDAQERMRLILQAYQTLSDTDERRLYDKQHAQDLGLSLNGTDAARQFSSSPVGASSTRANGDRRFAFPTLDTTSASTIDFVV